MRCLANTQGAKVRINAVLPGLLLTEWGLKYPKETIEMIKDRSALKHETYLDDCADMYVSIAENTSMTGQRIAVGEWLTSEFTREEELTWSDAGLNIASL
jgi:NAD(P)-dependent dehydrogenase (short-subunit alcohol dehydrogenase family)